MALSFPFSEAPSFGELTQVVPGILWLRLPLPYQLNHVNVWLLKDGDGWVLVDTGFPTEEVKAFWVDILAKHQGPIHKIISTHFHPDHLGLACFLQETTGAPLWMSSGEYLTAHAIWHAVGGHAPEKMFEQFRQHGLDPECLTLFKARGNPYRSVVPTLPEIYHRLKEGDQMVIDGKAWQFLVGYGHSPEHLSLYCPELDILISGDMLLPKISTNITVFAATPDADVLSWYLTSLERIASEIPDTALVLPSHGLPFKGIKERVNALEVHHHERLSVLEKACLNQPKSAADLLDTLFQRELDIHQLLFAMGEAIAHLNYLKERKRINQIEGEDSVFRFVLN